VVVGPAVLAIDFLGTHYLSCDAVRVMLFLLAVASLDILRVNSKEFQVLPLVAEILFQVFQKRREKSFGKSFNHVIGVDHKNWPWSFAKVALFLK
jgi:hypothetical protein